MGKESDRGTHSGSKKLEDALLYRDGVVKAVNGNSYSVNRGEVTAIVGESGSGKSVGVLSALRLIPEPPGKIESGQALLEGVDLIKLPKEALRGKKGQYHCNDFSGSDDQP